MKYLGIDYGSKRIGIGVSDADAKLAFPKKVIANDESTIKNIVDICSEENIGSIVVGESRNLSGEENPIMADIKKFISELIKRTNLPIFTEPEFFTSIEAERIQGTSGLNDASAAALILKSFLDRNNGI